MDNSILKIKNSITIYQTKAVQGKLIALSIEKELNYISRCARDIMLGTHYDINMNKIDKSILSISKNFNLLKQTILNTKDYDKKLALVKETKSSTMRFVNGVKSKMSQLKDSSSIQKEQMYRQYHDELTPLAVQSREYFLKIRQMKEEGFVDISNILTKNIQKERTFIAVSNFILSLITIAVMILIYIIIKKQVKTQNDLNNTTQMLSQYVIYSKTDTKGFITEVSDAFCDISQYNKDELIGKSHNVVRDPDMPESLFKEMWETIKKGDIWEGEVKNRKKEGGYYWVRSHVSPEYDKNGKNKGYIAIRYDITSKKDYEQQNELLAQSEKMASLGEMIGNIAHQWRQPLSAISSTASSIKMQEQLGIIDISELPQHMESIITKTEYLSDTISTFRDFIKGEKIYKEVSLQNEIAQALGIVSSILTDNNIYIKNNIVHKDQLLITMVSGELPQVIINIINNAKDILLEKEISNPLIELNITKTDNNAVISIEDNAGGIAEDILPKIFDPYFTTKHQSQGTGLGLHMSYQIITESLNGNLYAENTQRGAKFFIELPLNT
ncbi:MAG: ATP-binding protein [Campylobacterota bacterium]|nr:ATP-binding protein [Campylobacterota bacterium]